MVGYNTKQNNNMTCAQGRLVTVRFETQAVVAAGRFGRSLTV